MINQKKTSIVITYIGLIIGVLTYFLVTPVAIKCLGVNEFGIYNLVYTIVSYFTVLDFGLGNAIIRYTAKYRALNDKNRVNQNTGLFLIIYSILAIISLIIGIALIKNLTSIFVALNSQEIVKVEKMMNIALVNIAISFPLSVFLAILKGFEKFILAEVIHVMKIILSPFSIFVAIICGYKSIGIITIQTIVNIAISIIPLLYCILVLKLKICFPKKREDLKILPDILRFSFYVFLGIVVTKIFWSTDQVILGAFVSSTAVSICSLASQIIQYYSTMSETITKPYLTLITKDVVKAKGKMNFTQLFIKIGRIQFFLVFLMLSGFLIFGKNFLVLWAGDAFNDAFYIILFTLIPLTIPSIQNIGVAILQALNIHRFRSVTYFVIAIINIGLSLILVKDYGIYGTTFGTILALILGHVILMNLYYYKKLNLDLIAFWKNIFGILVRLLPLVLITYLLFNYFVKTLNWIMLGSAILIYVLIYVVILYKWVLNNSEKNIVFRFIPFLKMKGE